MLLRGEPGVREEKSYQNEELLLAVEQFRLRCGEAFTTVDGEASHVGC